MHCTARMLLQEMLRDKCFILFVALNQYHLRDVTLYQQLRPPVVSLAGFIISIQGENVVLLKSSRAFRPCRTDLSPRETLQCLAQCSSPDASVRFMIRPTVREQSQPVPLHTAACISLRLPHQRPGPFIIAVDSSALFSPLPLATFPVVLLHHQIQHFYGKPQSF